MPLFQIGYRRYEGLRTSHAVRWWPITRTGVAIAWRSKLLRRLVFVSFLPFLYFGWVFFVIGRITDPSADPNSPFYDMAGNFLGPELVSRLKDDPSPIRSAVWSMVFASFGNFIQLLMTGLVAAIAGPPLIANDLKSRAFLIYFSRPVSRLDYVLGKVGVMVGILACVTLWPNLLLYVMSILFSPSLATVAQTASVAGIVVLASLGMIIPVSLIVLTLSSLTRQPRFATVAWFVVCLFGLLTHVILSETPELRDNEWTFLLSLGNTVRALQLGMYDVVGKVEALQSGHEFANLAQVLSSPDSPVTAAVWLAIVSIACFLILLRRVDAPTRV